MGDYATYADVQPRVAGRMIDGSSKPTSTEVTTWCTAAENLLKGTLGAAGVSIPAAGSAGGLIMTEWISGYGEGRVRLAWDYTTQAGDGQAQIDEWLALIKDIGENGPVYDAMLNEGDSGEASSRVRGYPISNNDGLSIGGGDFDPQFDKNEEY